MTAKDVLVVILRHFVWFALQGIHGNSDFQWMSWLTVIVKMWHSGFCRHLLQLITVFFYIESVRLCHLTCLSPAILDIRWMWIFATLITTAIFQMNLG